MAAESFADRLRAEDYGSTVLDLAPWPTDGPPLERERGCYPDGTPGPRLLTQKRREGYTWHAASSESAATLRA